MREGVGNPSGVIGGTSRDLHSPSTSISESRAGVRKVRSGVLPADVIPGIRDICVFPAIIKLMSGFLFILSYHYFKGK